MLPSLQSNRSLSNHKTRSDPNSDFKSLERSTLGNGYAKFGYFSNFAMKTKLLPKSTCGYLEAIATKNSGTLAYGTPVRGQPI